MSENSFIRPSGTPLPEGPPCGLCGDPLLPGVAISEVEGKGVCHLECAESAGHEHVQEVAPEESEGDDDGPAVEVPIG